MLGIEQPLPRLFCVPTYHNPLFRAVLRESYADIRSRRGRKDGNSYLNTFEPRPRSTPRPLTRRMCEATVQCNMLACFIPLMHASGPFACTCSTSMRDDLQQCLHHEHAIARVSPGPHTMAVRRGRMYAAPVSHRIKRDGVGGRSRRIVVGAVVHFRKRGRPLPVLMRRYEVLT